MDRNRQVGHLGEPFGSGFDPFALRIWDPFAPRAIGSTWVTCSLMSTDWLTWVDQSGSGTGFAREWRYLVRIEGGSISTRLVIEAALDNSDKAGRFQMFDSTLGRRV